MSTLRMEDFAAGIHNDHFAVLGYADFLEEHGDYESADFIRDDFVKLGPFPSPQSQSMLGRWDGGIAITWTRRFSLGSGGYGGDGG